MSPAQHLPSRLEAAYAVIGMLQARLAARERHIAALHAQLHQLQAALRRRLGGVAEGREN